MAGLSVDGAEPSRKVLTDPSITEADRQHWAFRPLIRPEVPKVTLTPSLSPSGRGGGGEGWPRNPIDRFILAKLEAAGLQPMPPADPLTLLRRVTFDLTGLPPTPKQIEDFLNDPSPNAYERVVDRLLASSAYGERWAQHWLDVARFAETDGFEFDAVRPDAWKYRDWVIQALNEDMPYDQFVRLQIAGDELRPEDPQSQAAVQFLRCGPDMPDINLQEERRHSFLNEMTSTVGSAFLGLQMQCAQCHDHKYDPISQADFYRLRAFFAPYFEFTRYKPVRMLEKPVDEPSRFMIRGDFRRPGPQVEPAFPRIANPWGAEVSSLDGGSLGLPLSGRLLDGARGEAPPLNDESGPGYPTARSQLANWLTRPDHPLTTRVIVNRLWQYHFGYGLCRTPSDFGTMGEEPSHPNLLDWLAAELPHRNWGLKQMHRLMVTSATYRQASRPTNPDWTDAQRDNALQRWRKAVEVDPENRLLARMSRRRLEGEAVRDAMLATAGMLSSKRGGPGVRPPLPEELRITLLKDQWNVTENDAEHLRRSIYVFVRRNLQYPLFAVFDKPDTNSSCPRRNRSTIAPQALMLLNSKLSLDAAREFAGLLVRSAGPDPGDQIGLCYLRALGRWPTTEERRTAVEFLQQQTKRLRSEGRPVEELAVPASLPPDAHPYHTAALTDFCLAVFNLNEFIYID